MTPKKIEQINKAFRKFGKSNTLRDMAKWILTDPELYAGQLRQIRMVYPSGTTFDLDCKDHKEFKAAAGKCSFRTSFSGDECPCAKIIRIMGLVREEDKP